MSSIRVNDIFDELSQENNRLLNELMFANKCLKVLIKFKAFVDLASDELKTNLETNYLQIFDDLYKQLEEVVNTSKSFVANGQQSTEEVIEEKPILSDVIPDNEDTNETNQSFNTSFDDNENGFQFITNNSKKEFNDKNIDKNNDLVSNKIQWKCSDISCGLTFNRPIDLKNDSKTVDSTDKGLPLNCVVDRPFVCTVRGCGVRFKDMSNLRIHMKTNHSNYKLKCHRTDCGRFFKTKKTLTAHQKLCQMTACVSCEWPGCEFTTKTKLNLLTHNQRMHSTVENNKYVCQMDGCSQRFYSEDKLEEHMNRHNDVKPYVCNKELCDKAFHSKLGLRSHIRFTHKTTQKPFKCENNSCNKSFKTISALRTHQFTHSKSKSFECQMSGCQFKTHNPFGLRKHLLVTHSNDRPFLCQFEGCQFAFKTKSILNQHQRLVHSIDKQLVCDVDGCGKTFKSEEHLKNHQIIHTDRESVLCDWPGCTFSTKNKKNLSSHIKIRHLNERKHSCDWPECGKRFNTKQMLNQHIRIHKCDKKYVCSWPGCSFRCVFSGNLTKHMRVHRK